MSDVTGAGTAVAGAEISWGLVLQGFLNGISRLISTGVSSVKGALVALIKIVEARLRELIRLFIGLSRSMIQAAARNPSMGLAMMVFWRELIFG